MRLIGSTNSMELARARVILDLHEALQEYGLAGIQRLRKKRQFHAISFGNFQAIDTSVSDIT